MPGPASTSIASTSQDPSETERLRGRRDGWQHNVINTHVPFRDSTDPFLQALAEACRQMAMSTPTLSYAT